MSRMRLFALLFLSTSMAAAGCTKERAPRSYVQPNALKKSDLAGTWYYVQTVLDAPPSATSAFVGLSTDLLKVKFDIQEDVLYARRAFAEQFLFGTAQHALAQIFGKSVARQCLERVMQRAQLVVELAIFGALGEQAFHLPPLVDA